MECSLVCLVVTCSALDHKVDAQAATCSALECLNKDLKECVQAVTCKVDAQECRSQDLKECSNQECVPVEI